MVISLKSNKIFKSSGLKSKVNYFLHFKKKIKLKKKWRFWRSFKFFFLRKKSLSFFSKLKWFFNQKRVIWHHFETLYGKKIKSLVFNKMSKKIGFGKDFFWVISFFELRLNIILLRFRFASKLLEANLLIAKGLILVNNGLKKKNYLIRVNDNIKKKFVYLIKKQYRFLKKKRRKFKWRRFFRKQKRIYRLQRKINVYWLAKTLLSLNYLEVNYKIKVGFILKSPIFGEILIKSSKKFLAVTMLKKIYFLF